MPFPASNWALFLPGAGPSQPVRAKPGLALLIASPLLRPAGVPASPRARSSRFQGAFPAGRGRGRARRRALLPLPGRAHRGSFLARLLPSERQPGASSPPLSSPFCRPPQAGGEQARRQPTICSQPPPGEAGCFRPPSNLVRLSFSRLGCEAASPGVPEAAAKPVLFGF